MSPLSTTWANNEPRHISIALPRLLYVTCLKLSRGRIITAAADHHLLVHSLKDGHLIQSLEGHSGGIWSLGIYRDTLVASSRDGVIHIWDLCSGKHLHTFSSYASTLAIVEPELAEDEQDDTLFKERWRKRPLIVTGNTDYSIGVWTLPLPGEREYKTESDAMDDHAKDIHDRNPYFTRKIEAHTATILSLAARCSIAVTGSFDYTVRVWDIISGECKWVLMGHTDKVAVVALDLNRNQVYSGSSDATVRIWNIRTGECQHILKAHSSHIGFLSFSPCYLVSASLDGTQCIWDPISGQLLHQLAGPMDSISSFQHDDRKVFTGSLRSLKLWDIQKGILLKDLAPDDMVGVWRVAFSGRYCVAAVYSGEAETLNVWDFIEDDGWTDEEAFE